MSFYVFDPRGLCPYRNAGRILTRGLGSISLATLSEMMGCERFIGRWV